MLRQGVERGWMVTAGLLAVMVGLMLFMEGLKLGLMPLGESASATPCQARSPLPVVLVVAFLLGIGVTLAEPAIGALQEAGKIVEPAKARRCWRCSSPARPACSRRRWASASGWPR